MDRDELYEDGFMDVNSQIKVLYRRGKSVNEISEKLGLSVEKINEIISEEGESYTNLNE